MSERSTGVRVLVASAVCVVAFGFTACGDDEEDGGGGAATTSESGTAENTDSSSDEGQSLSDALRDGLETSGVESSAVDCIVDEIEKTLSPDEVAAAEEAIQKQNGELPEAVVDASFDATAQCVNE